MAAARGTGEGAASNNVEEPIIGDAGTGSRPASAVTNAADVAVSLDWWDAEHLAVAFRSGRLCVFPAPGDANDEEGDGATVWIDSLADVTSPLGDAALLGVACAGEGATAVVLGCERHCATPRGGWTAASHVVTAAGYYVWGERAAPPGLP